MAQSWQPKPLLWYDKAQDHCNRVNASNSSCGAAEIVLHIPNSDIEFSARDTENEPSTRGIRPEDRLGSSYNRVAILEVANRLLAHPSYTLTPN